MTNLINIVHCAESIKGGVATYLREIIKLQAQEYGCNNVKVVIPASQISELEIPLGVEKITFNDNSSRYLSSIRCSIVAIRTALKYNSNIIHLHSTFAGLFTRIFGFIFGKSTIYCAHGWAWDMPVNRIFKYIIIQVEKFLYLFSDAIICISEHDLKSAKNNSYPMSKVHLVRNGISINPPKACVLQSKLWPNECTLKILFVGRLDKQKGITFLLEALKYLGPKYHLVIAGSYVLHNQDNWLPPSNVTFTGWINSGQLEYLYRESDVVVIPSLWEGFGLVAVEAMRAEKVVVASAVGGLPEIVLNGITGILVSPGDSILLAKTLSNLNATSVSNFGAMGKDRFNNLFTIDRTHRELTNIYLKIIKNIK